MSRNRIVLATLAATGWVAVALLLPRLRSRVPVRRPQGTAPTRAAPERELLPEDAPPAETLDLRAPDQELLATIDDEWANDIPDLGRSR